MNIKLIQQKQGKVVIITPIEKNDDFGMGKFEYKFTVNGNTKYVVAKAKDKTIHNTLQSYFKLGYELI